MELSATNMIYAVFSQLCDEHGYVRDISQREIASLTGLDTATVSAAIRVLAHDRLVVRQGHSPRTGTTIYAIHPSAYQRPAPEPAPAPVLTLVRGDAS